MLLRSKYLTYLKIHTPKILEPTETHTLSILTFYSVINL